MVLWMGCSVTCVRLNYIYNLYIMRSIFELQLNLDPEYQPFINDIFKFSTMYIMMELLRNYTHGKSKLLRTSFLINTVLFSAIGLAVYHLIVHKIIKIQ